uniref:Putative tick transposon n=1 Tax=Rhipicephalus microplus TaxID=6941 RepID=A0A6G5A933_RHIMP
MRVDVLRISEQSVTLPPRASVLVDVTCCGLSDGDVVAETNLEHLLQQGICVARSVIHVRDGRSELLVTNFSNEHRHLFRGTSIAFAHEVANVTNCPTSEIVDNADTSMSNIDINPDLSTDNQTALRALLFEYRSCFASCSKIRQTSITQHRIITYEDARPIHQHPYRVSAKEREAIRTQVREVLDDGVIEPSNSPWSSPVVLVQKEGRVATLLRRLPKA